MTTTSSDPQFDPASPEIWEVAPGVEVDVPRVWNVTFSEQSDACQNPYGQGTAYGGASAERMFRIGVPFLGAPFSTFPVASNHFTVMTGAGTEAQEWIDTDLYANGEVYTSDRESGSISVTPGADLTTVTLELSGLLLNSRKGVPLKVDSSIELDLAVSCAHLRAPPAEGEDGDTEATCDQDLEAFPYTSDSCREATAGFPDDVKQ